MCARKTGHGLGYSFAERGHGGRSTDGLSLCDQALSMEYQRAEADSTVAVLLFREQSECGFRARSVTPQRGSLVGGRGLVFQRPCTISSSLALSLASHGPIGAR